MNQANQIYDQMLSAAKFPDNLMSGSPESVEDMRRLFHRPRY
jgi:hypothetical protein